jgi:hypothetical protein
LENLLENQKPTHVTNNNITNNITIFLHEDCKDAMNMSDFIKGIKFCKDNFDSSNLLIANALDHTAEIFQNHFNELTLNKRPIHNFYGED